MYHYVDLKSALCLVVLTAVQGMKRVCTRHKVALIACSACCLNSCPGVLDG